MDRRRFLSGAAGVAGIAGLGAMGLGCSSSNNTSSGSSSTTGGGSGTPGSSTVSPPGTQLLPKGKDAPFDTVVIFMMENRSFDHMLGWLPGANGKQEGLTYLDGNDQPQKTYHLPPDFTGCNLQDPGHLWQQVAKQYNDGKMDGFLKTQPQGDTFPIGYYLESDLPALSVLARNYTTFDNYFCSMLGPTWPNRFYQLCATTDVPNTGFFPGEDQPRPSNLELAIFDRLKEAGLSAGYYYWSEPMTGLFASKKYDAISYPYSQFLTDAKAGKLPNVTFVEPNYGGGPEFSGTSNDDHPYGDIRVGEGFIAEVYNALKTSPQWDRMVAVLNFDEHGGFYDHVAPPACVDDTVLPGNGPFPDLKHLGIRVPAIAMGPFAPQKIDSNGPYEHCSILKMIEWRWDLKPMTSRDANAKNLAESLDFSTKRKAIEIPAFTAPTPEPCTNTKHLP